MSDALTKPISDQDFRDLIRYLVAHPAITEWEVAGKRMSFTMSCDHRVIDGAVGARYLKELVDLLEHPESLAL